MYSQTWRKPNRFKKFVFRMTATAVVVGLVCWAGYYVYNYFSRSRDFDGIIVEAARRNGIDSLLLKSVIRQESGFDPDARGNAGEVGLMQIMPGANGAAQDWADAHRQPLPCRGVMFNPALNVEIGSWYLARALRRWSSYKDAVELALCEYNAGLSRARMWKPVTYDGDVSNQIGYRSTRVYVKSIVNRYREWRKKRGE